MDATRTRRTKDPVRQQWYASSRQFRFTRHMFGPAEATRLSAIGSRPPAKPAIR